MTDFLLNLLRTLPVVSGLLIVASVNVKREHRVRQTWMPLVALLVSLVALIFLYAFNDNFRTTFAQASEAAPGVPSAASLALLYVAENTIVLLIYAAVKLLLKPFFAKLFSREGKVATSLVARIYEYDADLGLWFIESRFRRSRDMYRVLYWTSMALTVAFIAFALTFPSWPGFAAVAFPAVATMIIGEFYFAIDGLTRSEYRSEIFGERDSARRLGNFGPLRRILRDAFPDRVIGDGVHLSSLAALESGYRVGEMSRDPDPNVRLAGNYFERLRAEGTDVDVNLVSATTAIMSGSNVVFANPFHQDLGRYLALPVYRELLEGRKCLIIAGRSSQGPEFVKWMTSSLENVTGVPGLWRVRVLDEASRDDIDVGILTFSDVYNLSVLVNNEPFFRDTSLMILAEPSLMLTTGQLGLEIVLERCNRESETVVAAFDGNHDGLIDTLSHLLKSELTEVVASPLPQGVSCEVVWRGDGTNLHNSILPGVSRYLGVGTEIGAVALKYQVGQVHWVGGDSFPVTDMKWIAEQYYPSINSFADLEMSQDALNEGLVPVANPWDLGQEDNYFLVVEDEAHNVYETVRQYATRAKRSGFINLISDDYLLRDYMVQNRGIFSVDPKAVPSIVPDYTRTERNVILRLILTLRAFGMTEAEIQRQLDLINWTASPEEESLAVERIGEWEPISIRRLRSAIGRYTQCWQAPIVTLGPRRLGSILIDEEPRYVLESGSELDVLLASLGPAYFFVEDDKDGVNVIGSMLLDHVYQAILPGQFITYSGKYYEVYAITGEPTRPQVVLRRAADHIRDRRVYRQLRRYVLSDIRTNAASTAMKRLGTITVSTFRATVEAETLGYLQLSTRSALDSARRVAIHDAPLRRYSGKSIMAISLPDASPEVRRTIAVLLNEIFVTVFPNAHQFIVAVTPDSDRSAADLLPELIVRSAEDNQDLDAARSIFIIEDSLIDLGLTVAVERNWERLLEIATDYLAWNESPESLTEEAHISADSVNPQAIFPERPVTAEPRKTGLFAGFIARIRRIFHRQHADGDRKAPGRPEQPEQPEQGSDQAGSASSSQPADSESNDEVSIARDAPGTDPSNVADAATVEDESRVQEDSSRLGERDDAE